MLELNHLEKSYGKNKIIHELNYRFDRGIYGLLGPNGAGKTTLINMIAAASMPTAGEVLYRGQNILKDGQKYYASLGYLPQEDCLYPNFTAEEYLFYFAAMKGLPRDLAVQRIEKLSKICHLDTELKKKCGRYSGGMKRRLGLIQALLNNPRVLILDEPTSGLDPMERMSLRNLIVSLARDRVVIYSTHIVPDIEQIAERIIFLKKGRIVLEGKERELLQRAEGKVWELIIDGRELECFARQHKIISSRQMDSNQLKVRYVSDDKLPQARPVPASLEDLFAEVFK